MKRLIFVVLFFLLVITNGQIGVSLADNAEHKSTDSIDMKVIVKFYNIKCAMCHGKKGEGAPRMAKMIKVPEKLLVLEKDKLKKTSDKILLEILLDGKNKMPGYRKQLSVHEAEKLIDYMRAFK